MRREKQRIRFVPRRKAFLPSDTEGSYTGVPLTDGVPPEDPMPVQDADDL